VEHSEQDAFMAEYDAIELGGLSGPESTRDSEHPSVFAISLDPGVRSSRRTLEWLVFAGSLALHGALYLRIHNNVTPQVTRFVRSQVDIELAAPIPTEEPKIKEPDPIPPPPADKPIPHLETHAPVAQAAPVELPDNSNLPSSDEGLLPPTPPGTGAPGPAPIAAPPPPPPPPPAPIIPVKLGANFGSTLHPQYPRAALREEWEGTVVVRVQILPSGHVGTVTVVKSSGHPALDDSAVAEAKVHVFNPATQGGVPVVGSVSFPVTFRLE
jgi:protein TonB